MKSLTPTDIEPPEDHEPRVITLTEGQMDAIAERAVDKVFTRIYAEVGKGVLKKLAWALGLIVTALAMWLAGTGGPK